VSRTPAPPFSPSRRAFLGRVARAGGVFACALPTLVGCVAARREPRPWEGRFLTIVTAGGAVRQALRVGLFAPFAEATGCRVSESVLPIDDLVVELRRQIAERRIEWDIVALDAPRLAVLARDESRPLARLERQPDAASAPLPLWLRESGVAILGDTLALAVRSGPFNGALPRDWGAAWDTGRFPGPRYFPRDPVGLLEIALLADGVAVERLYPLDLDRAFRALDRLRPAIHTWWRQAARGDEALTLGQADLALARGGDLRAALATGASAALAPLPMPSLLLTFAVLQGAPNADLARDFLAYATGPTAQTSFGEQGYRPITALDTPGTFAPDLTWWGEQGRDALARFAQWLAR